MSRSKAQSTSPKVRSDSAMGWVDSPFQRTRDLSCRMVAWQSVSGTPGEAAFAEKLRELLLEIPYFAANPDDIILLDSHGEPMTQNLVALVRGQGHRTLALAGHFDTVSVDNYHDLAALACLPDQLISALVTDLSGRELSEQEACALADLQGGDFLPGRGMLDMKSGVAAGIVALERYSRLPERLGNLVLLVTPDEERESRGMRALRRDLPATMSDRGLIIEAGINLDATSDQGDGSLGRAVYEGTIGKLLPFAFVIGQSSHAAYPFEGISAQLIGAEILRRIEGKASLADTGAGDTSPPPICLEARDLRDGYEVTTPERYWMSFNWLYHSFCPVNLFAKFRAEVEAALAEATASFSAQAEDFARLSGTKPASGLAVPRTVTFAEVKALALGSEETARDFATYGSSLSDIDNPLVLSRLLADWLCDAARLKGPTVVVGFAGLHYPPSRLDPATDQGANLIGAIRAAEVEICSDAAMSLCWRPYFQGISDMSFLGRPAQPNAEVVASNTPAERLIDRPAADALDFPAVNIGPWGREFHQRLERVHAPYAFDVLPRLLFSIATHFLAPPEGSNR